MFAKFVWLSIQGQGGVKGRWIWNVEGFQRFGFELLFDFKMGAVDISMVVVNETLAGRPKSESPTSHRL
jgi:hypothetical protein